ncbi:Hypothetical predicted protein [Mytilus galloprovincialis]|nr:Hypothetical predicted protein [Mytilus galloprovincialis]
MLLLICSLYVLCVDSVPENSILNTQQSTGTELSQICTPVGLNKNQIHRPQTIKRSTNGELVWIGAFVLYTPWMEFKGIYGNISIGKEVIRGKYLYRK